MTILYTRGYKDYGNRTRTRKNRVDDASLVMLKLPALDESDCGVLLMVLQIAFVPSALVACSS